MYHYNWWGMLMMWIFGWLILIAVVVLLVKLLDNSNIFGNRNKGKEKESPMDILKRRYANGEITTEEFEKQKEVLKKN